MLASVGGSQGYYNHDNVMLKIFSKIKTDNVVINDLIPKDFVFRFALC